MKQESNSPFDAEYSIDKSLKQNVNTENINQKKRTGNWLSKKIIAVTLSFALLGGIAGGSITGYLFRDKNDLPVTLTSDSTQYPEYLEPMSSKPDNSINSVYEKYKNAVVSVTAESTTTNRFKQTTPTTSLGTGFIITSDGYLLTNNHVINSADKVHVTLFDNQRFDAKVIGADDVNDVALLKIEATGLNTVKLGNSDSLKVGETIFAIGHPLGELTYAVTAGIVSAKNREVNDNGAPINMFQTDAAINPGNSGGPIFNLEGEAVGIATAKYSDLGIEGIGFAIPINDAINVSSELKTTGYIASRPYLGVSITDLTTSNTSSKLSEGAYVASVDSKSGAAKAGIQQGDIITALNDFKVKTSSDLIGALKNYKAGNKVKISVYRNGQYYDIKVTLDGKKPNV